MDISWTIPSIIFGSAIMKILIRAVSRLNLEVRSIMGNVFIHLKQILQYTISGFQTNQFQMHMNFRRPEARVQQYYILVPC